MNLYGVIISSFLNVELNNTPPSVVDNDWISNIKVKKSNFIIVKDNKQVNRLLININITNPETINTYDLYSLNKYEGIQNIIKTTASGELEVFSLAIIPDFEAGSTVNKSTQSDVYEIKAVNKYEGLDNIESKTLLDVYEIKAVNKYEVINNKNNITMESTLDIE